MRLIRVLFAVYLTLVLAVTMWPSPETTSAPGWAQGVLSAVRAVGIPLTLPVLEASANVVMFLPFGVLGVPVIRGWRRGGSALSEAGRVAARPGWVGRPRMSVRATVGITVVAGAVLSALIETVQLTIPGRVSTLQDVAMNTLGALLGALVVGGAIGLRERRARVSSRP